MNYGRVQHDQMLLAGGNILKIAIHSLWGKWTAEK